VGPRLLLFDIDGTLLSSGGAGMRAVWQAFRQRFGKPAQADGVIPHGKTDPMILREVLQRNGIVHDQDREVAALTELYQQLFPAELACADQARLLPGVVPLLESVARRSELPLGLLTGNFEPTGWLKLAHFGIDHHFAFGAFGSDAEQREELVPIAVARAERHIGRQIGLGPHVLVIGDTPRDIRGALAHGATPICVATGRHSAAQLRAEGASVVLESFENIAASLKALGLAACA